MRQATWVASCPEAQRMRVEALGYRAAHAAHQEVMRSGLKDGRGMCGSPLRFVPRWHPSVPKASQLYIAWPVGARAWVSRGAAWACLAIG